jgi:plasmid stability protein
MSDYTVKNIPEELRARLEAEAERSFRSMNQEILFRLQRTFDADDARITSLHAKWIYQALASGRTKKLTVAELDAAIDRGIKQAKSRKRAAA